jgi:hypothetical protein
MDKKYLLDLYKEPRNASKLDYMLLRLEIKSYRRLIKEAKGYSVKELEEENEKIVEKIEKLKKRKITLRLNLDIHNFILNERYDGFITINKQRIKVKFRDTVENIKLIKRKYDIASKKMRKLDTKIRVNYADIQHVR